MNAKAFEEAAQLVVELKKGELSEAELVQGAKRLKKARHWPEAVRLYELALDGANADSEGILLKALADLEHRYLLRPARAADYLRRIIESGWADGDAAVVEQFVTIAEKLDVEKDLLFGLLQAVKVAESVKAEADALHKLALFYWKRQGELPAADDAFTRALGRSEESLALLIDGAELYSEMDKWHQVKRLLDRLVHKKNRLRKADRIRLLYLEARQHESSGRSDEACDAYMEMFKMGRVKHDWLWFALLCARGQRRWDELIVLARAILDRGRSELPLERVADVQFHLGVAYSHSATPAEANIWFDRVLELSPNHAGALAARSAQTMELNNDERLKTALDDDQLDAVEVIRADDDE